MAKSGYQRLSDSPKEQGQDVAHERLYAEIPITEAGYVYIYLSNEHESIVEVFFDDFRVEHARSPIVQVDDYYPFGLTFNSYRRESSILNQFLYNGKEYQDELDVEWIDYGTRMYDPQIGRWHVMDPLSEKARRWTPYRYAFNNPVGTIDPDGMYEADIRGGYGESLPVSSAVEHSGPTGELPISTKGGTKTQSTNTQSISSTKKFSASAGLSAWRNKERKKQQGELGSVGSSDGPQEGPGDPPTEIGRAHV